MKNAFQKIQDRMRGKTLVDTWELKRGKLFAVTKHFIGNDVNRLPMELEEFVHRQIFPNSPSLGRVRENGVNVRTRFDFDHTERDNDAFQKALDTTIAFIDLLVPQKENYIISWKYVTDCFKHYYGQYLHNKPCIAFPLPERKVQASLFVDVEDEPIGYDEEVVEHPDLSDALKGSGVEDVDEGTKSDFIKEGFAPEIPEQKSESTEQKPEKPRKYRNKSVKEYSEEFFGTMLKNMVTGEGGILLPSYGSGVSILYTEDVRGNNTFCIGSQSDVVDIAYEAKNGEKKAYFSYHPAKDNPPYAVLTDSADNPRNKILSDASHWIVLAKRPHRRSVPKEDLRDIAQFAYECPNWFFRAEKGKLLTANSHPNYSEIMRKIKAIGEEIKHTPIIERDQLLMEHRIKWNQDKEKRNKAVAAARARAAEKEAKARAEAEAKARAEREKRITEELIKKAEILEAELAEIRTRLSNKDSN